ncbi:MAG: isocitrate lyase/PEP mutase family protein [Solirubrobacteraceae bacterium]
MPSFLELHRPGDPLLCPNPWDVGSARLLASLGFEALATTSVGFAATLGRLDGEPSPEESLSSAGAIAAAVSVPVTADLEDCYAETLEGVDETVRRAISAGLAGCSIEDWTGDRVYPIDVAAARVEAAVAAAGDDIVLTARADNHFHGVRDLADTIARLRAFEAAGAHVLYAPGPDQIDDIRRVIDAVSRPVNVLLRPGGPTVAELAAAGAARITVGGSFAFAALGALKQAALELRDSGTAEYTHLSKIGQRAAAGAFKG